MKPGDRLSLMPRVSAIWRLGAPILILFGLLIPAAHAEPVRIGGTGAGSVLMQRLAQEYQRVQPDARVEVVMPPLSSGGGVRALAAGRLDLAVIGRPLKAEESASGNLGPAKEFVGTPLALASSAANAANLTQKELADIYAGRTTKWRDGSSIRLVLRSREESDNAVLRRLSPEISAAIDASFDRTGMPIADNDLDAIDLIAKTPGSLGPVTLGLARLDGRPLHLIALDGVAPDTRNLAAGKYPALKSIYLVTGTKPAPRTDKFIAFLHGDKVRQMLLDAGFLPQSQWPATRPSR